ncbi:hypothetical protein PR048_020733 [Dryococelus australis]|uniref:DDE-1 domain-containing protein n=1 Tax=Dryococelus australis TaxID=614101 RepID=A0ABQ9H742_9NEOP|nr:hypothetical protein PR048_020733 [Dryococelus australis]
MRTRQVHFTTCFKTEHCVKGEMCRGANADGTVKLTLLVIGKYAKPQCFKNIKKLPCICKYNSSSWMTSAVFKSDFTLNACMSVLDLKIMFTNCLTHTAW